MRNSLPRVAVVLGIVVTMLTGCGAQGGVGAPAGSSPPPSSPPQPGDPAEPPGPPALVDDGTASENHAFFDLVVTGRITAGAALDGRSVIEALVGAGFEKAAMQVTPDTTTLGNQADSVVFSVQIADECLIGQWNGETYSSTVASALGTGGCLPGNTRPIDW